MFKDSKTIKKFKIPILGLTHQNIYSDHKNKLIALLDLIFNL